MHKIGCHKEALDGYLNLIEKLKKKDKHSLTEMYYCSQAYYRVGQLHLNLKFLEKASFYMTLYEKLQANYLEELSKVDSSFEATVKREFLENQFLKRKAWVHHCSWENETALDILINVYKTEKR